MVPDFTISDGMVVEIEAISNPERPRGLDLTVLGDRYHARRCIEPFA
jgi:hypothetical protein